MEDADEGPRKPSHRWEQREKDESAPSGYMSRELQQRLHEKLVFVKAARIGEVGVARLLRMIVSCNDNLVASGVFSGAQDESTSQAQCQCA